jgi:hypothetical protein
MRRASGQALREIFQGHVAEHYTPVKMPRVDVAMLIGEVEQIAYNTVRDGKKERYLHKFKASARPLLAASHDGKTLLIIEGDFEFTERGITDNE